MLPRYLWKRRIMGKLWKLIIKIYKPRFYIDWQKDDKVLCFIIDGSIASQYIHFKAEEGHTSGFIWLE